MSTLSRSEGRPSGPAFSPLAAALFPASGPVGLQSLHSQLSLQCRQGQAVLSRSVQHPAWCFNTVLGWTWTRQPGQQVASKSPLLFP